MTATETAHRPSLARRLLHAMDLISILPCRILLETPGVAATVPMLRGVWGAALRELDRTAYDRIFEGDGGRSPSGNTSAPHEKTPLYVLRPAPPDPAFAPAVEWILIADAVADAQRLARAWQLAARSGLGPDRRPFSLRRWLCLEPAGQPAEKGRPWRLGQCTWPCSHAETTPCQLRFDAPLRLRRHGKLIEQPSLTDLVVAAGRRVGSFLSATDLPAWKSLEGELIDLARHTPAEPWQGDRLDLTRYSGRQRRELDMHGVCGSLVLPDGPGSLWPLLAAACWLHIGKGTVMGLGQLHIVPVSETR
ncbi:MAG: CRISPR system precrRNA processing endoribonuclease RAMP protein Cas6 [Thermoguttaceae bacterium]|nr:CRISPR system precrRNA processing endoribonuclease RAMP protein Cas6 [Thermoguttaceae bacterium]